jgi:hypothetical protein
MTLEPTMLAVEERLQRLSSSMPAPDVEAGWAALSALLEPPVAPVVPLRPKPSRFRPIALAAAAAILVAGSAFAAVTQHGPAHIVPPPPIEVPGGFVAGPHLHRPFAGPALTSDDRGGPHRPGGPSTGGPSTGGTAAPSGGGAARGHEHRQRDHAKQQDDPNDLDQGTGNDGQHNDNGGGNDGTEGSQPRGQGHGDGTGHDPQSNATGTGGGGHGQGQDRGQGRSQGQGQGQANGNDH